MLSFAHPIAPSERRRGAVLLVVMTLLTLFAAVGLSFVYYADSEAAASKLVRDSESLYSADVEPELALSYFLGKLIYGDTDDAVGGQNAARGHELARTIFSGDYNTSATGAVSLNKIRAPYSGTGRLHYLHDPLAPVIAGVDDYDLVNYTRFAADGFMRDPEHLGWRTDPTAAIGAYCGGFNAPWTYPDLNTMALGAVRADGTVLTPSFHREYLFGRLDDATNPNWKLPIGKYLTLRPRPIDNYIDPVSGLPAFPYPEGRFGDVKNLPWGPGGPDSIWMDFGAPVITGPDGRKYKMLFAPLVIDLDGRVNLNVHGNIKGPGSTHAANQGLGRWEVNLTKVFPVAAEVPNLFTGSTTVPNPGRYGPPSGTDPTVPPYGAVPTPYAGGTRPPQGPWYTPVDLDGVNAGPLALPTAGSLLAFPSYPAGYDNGSAAELANHPARFSYYAPTGGDRTFRTSNMEAVLRYRDKGSPALTSELFRLMPQSFSQPRIPGLVTTRSFDVANPGLTPYVWDPSAAATSYKLAVVGAIASSAPFPSGTAIPFPALQQGPPLTPTPPPNASGDFQIDWRAVPTALSRLDLNRDLPDYPAPDATGMISDNANFTIAQAARQQFAKDIYNLLVKATGAQDPNGAAPPIATGTVQFQAARCLAQLAVNIVDYIDNDDYMTPFPWVKDSTGTVVETLYGTELPRLLLNEAYVQIDNDPTDPGVMNKTMATKYQLNVWVEMHNPFKPTPAGAVWPRDNGSAVLQFGAQVPYRIDVCQPTVTTLLSTPTAASLANALGDPNFSVVAPATNILGSVTTWGANANQQVVLPANGAYNDGTRTNVGFFVVGPQPPNPPLLPTNLPVTFATPNLSIPIVQGGPPTPQTTTILLRRLACPLRPFDAVLNPYVTVDYMDGLPTNDGRSFNPGAVAVPPVVTNFSAMGRKQPYAADSSQRAFQNPATPPAGQPKNTFYRHNAIEDNPPPSAATANQTLTIPFDWLLHMDRPLSSPMELLHVSGFRPHLLTHQFIIGANKHKHYAPWFDETAPAGSSNRLYRFFELVRTHDLAAGMDGVSRVPGLVNVNTIWEPEIVAALCNNDPAALAIFNQLIALRTPTFQIGPTDAHKTAVQATALGYPLNSPFRSLTTGATTALAPALPQNGGQYPVTTGINNTILRAFNAGGAGTTTRLFDDPAAGLAHPYLKHAPLRMMFNNLTTRSNVFAVFVTVGFFEVKDDTTRPVKLGAEIGRAENRNVRHRMFAIVDRSDLRVLSFTIVQGNIVASATQPANVIFTSLSGSLTFNAINGNQFTVFKGDVFIIEPNLPTEETVLVTGAGVADGLGADQFQVTAFRPHPVGATMILRGNPGPWTSYNPRLDTNAVPFFSVID